MMGIQKKIAGRTIATVVLKISTTGGGSALLGAELWLSLALAAWVGILEVAEEVSKAYLNDGKITEVELNESAARIIAKNTKEK
jgi:hypothetical protein